jgi:hypothetical protein
MRGEELRGEEEMVKQQPHPSFLIPSLLNGAAGGISASPV